MSVPTDLITYLDPLVAETAGTTLFEGPPPSLPTDVVVLTHYGGEKAEGRVFAASVTAPGVEVSRIQLFVRNSVMTTAKSKADIYHALLDGLFGSLSGRTYFFVESIDGPPHGLGRDDRLLWRYVVNYQVKHTR